VDLAMRILFLSQLVPYPLDAGPKVRSYYVLRWLAGAGHEVTLLAFSRESDTAAAIDHLRAYCAAVHTVPMPRSRARDAYHLGSSLLSGQPFLIARDSVDAMQAMVRDLAAVKAFDAVHADQLWMAPYALTAAGSARSKPLLVLDQHNAMFLIPQRLAESSGNPAARALLRREAAVMARYERETCRRFDEVVWVTAEDRTAVGLDGETTGAMPCQRVIPICVDPDGQATVERVARPHRVTFLGGLHWPPNAAGIVWFAREVWPRLRAEFPDAVLTVIGKNPPAELTSGAPSAVRGLDITGYVDDPLPYLRETAAFIVPLHAGGGMRVKILDAWAWGLPVVSTTIGAEGIATRDGDNLLIADDADSFAAAVGRVLLEQGLAAGLSTGGRRTVETDYNWRTIYAAWDAVYPSGRVSSRETPAEAHVYDIAYH
jgi:glycosyltransferase involved in cell wall biosynthesis